MRRVISLFKVTNAIVNLVFCTPLRTALPSASQAAHTDRHIRTIYWDAGAPFCANCSAKVKAGNPFLDDMLKLKLYEATKGKLPG